MEFFLEHILEIRSEFPQQCNPNLLACEIWDFLNSSSLAEHIRNFRHLGETPDQTRMWLLRPAEDSSIVRFPCERRQGV